MPCVPVCAQVHQGVDHSEGVQRTGQLETSDHMRFMMVSSMHGDKTPWQAAIGSRVQVLIASID